MAGWKLNIKTKILSWKQSHSLPIYIKKCLADFLLQINIKLIQITLGGYDQIRIVYFDIIDGLCLSVCDDNRIWIINVE